MNDEQPTFGSLLRAARLRAGFATQAALADRLSAIGLVYSDEAIGHWERDRRVPSREIVLRVLEVLAEAGGVESLTEVNRMLWLLDWRDLDADEHAEHFSGLAIGPGLVALPARPFDRLMGRDSLVESLVTRLVDPDDKPVLVISGLGGIGKTAVAWEVVRRAMGTGVFDGLAWTSAKSEEFTGTTIRVRGTQHVDLTTVLLSMAAQLGHESLSGISAERLRQQLRGILQRNPHLIVLDNLETLDAARDVALGLYELISPAAGPRSSKVLITSRERLVDESYVYDEFVRGLSEPDALALLDLEAQARGAESWQLVGDLLRHQAFTVTGGMPLALKLLMSQVLLGIPVEVELERLAQATDEEQLYRFIYFALWEKLSLNAQKMVIGAATFASSAMRSMLMRVGQIDAKVFDQTVTELVRASLLEVIADPDPDQQRYDVHAMTRWFVNAPLTEMWNRQKQVSGGS